MIYYLIENTNGFETLVFEGTKEESQRKKLFLEEKLNATTSEDKGPWPIIKYYILQETEWTNPIGTMH